MNLDFSKDKIDWNSLDFVWDKIINEATKSKESGEFSVQIIYKNGNSNFWNVIKEGIYVEGHGHPHKDKTKYNFYSKPNDKRSNDKINSDPILQAAILISEAARFQIIRSYLKNVYQNDNLLIIFDDIKPIVTKWDQTLVTLGLPVNKVISNKDLMKYWKKQTGTKDYDTVIKFIRKYSESVELTTAES
ncbi:hypothetical protein [Vibrio coralliilyticus]|uniref:hypothetical protein n=1 Tax=Vibrio coralliilyticus TaxID=190893 RepID=UPI00156136BB|nr:hypothetical protein [Vibrio coralliilyticus]NRF28245.1 hypothetical protein [Vibrio coralliilyticus]NRF51944.1 hypothetical protein [Vibrio coralliilyticus]